MKKTVLFTLIAILLLLLASQLNGWRHDALPMHPAAQWKEISLTRIKPAGQQDEPKADAPVSTIKVLKPEHVASNPDSGKP